MDGKITVEFPPALEDEPAVDEPPRRIDCCAENEKNIIEQRRNELETVSNGDLDNEKLQTKHRQIPTSSELSTTTLKSSLFSGVILAYWDNIMGPMISRIWKGNQKVDITKDMINYVSNHTLSGELCRQTDRHTIDPKFYVLPELGYMFFAVIFTGHSSMGETISSLSFVMAYTDLDCYLLLQEFIYEHVKVMVLKYRILQHKDLIASVQSFATYLQSFVKVIDSLQHLSLPSKICINDTVFGESKAVTNAELLNSKFLMRAITSYIQTCGCAVVVGTSIEKINLMLSTLAVFLGEPERYCSRKASSDESVTYQRDLWLQGILWKKHGDEVGSIKLPVSSKDVILSSRPVTMIDVDEKTVLQTSILNEHCSTQKEFLKLELSLLLQGEEAPVYPILNLFHDFQEISTLAQQFISEVFAVPNHCSLRQTYIENFISMLEHKSKALLSYVEAKSEQGTCIVDHVQLRLMKQDLQLISDSDFKMVLAWAEKLRPGVASFLLGDPMKQDLMIKNADAMHHFATMR